MVQPGLACNHAQHWHDECLDCGRYALVMPGHLILMMVLEGRKQHTCFNRINAN